MGCMERDSGLWRSESSIAKGVVKHGKYCPLHHDRRNNLIPHRRGGISLRKNSHPPWEPAWRYLYLREKQRVFFFPLDLPFYFCFFFSYFVSFLWFFFKKK